MAQFPYLLEAGFEAGATNFDTAITDTTTKSSYPFYVDLISRYGINPWRGSYCWLIDQSTGTTTTAVNQTHAAFDVAASSYWSVAFAFYAKSTVMANGNRTSLVVCSATATDEVNLQLYYTTAGGLQLLLTEANDTVVGTNPVVALVENKWHWIELHGMVDAGVGNDGTAYLVLDGVAAGSIDSLDQGAFTDLLVGLMNIDAGHTAGVYVIDDLIISGLDTSAVRVGLRKQYPQSVHVSARSNALDASGYGQHLFVGPGTVADAAILTANAGDILRLYDTDNAYTTGSYNLVAECNFSSGAVSVTGPVKFERGCYCLVIPGGTGGARGIVNIALDPPAGYPIARCYGYPANLRQYARHRLRLSGDV